jgi:SAM-dependent methyltransferase
MTKTNDFDSEAEYYDLFEMKNQPLYDSIANFLEALFKQGEVKTILEGTCGTGAQAIPLARRGFNVVGSDIGKNLLRIARQKGKGIPNLKFVSGDVRYSRFGRFDAVISMLNSMGYLDKTDFNKAVANIGSNLKDHGLFVFDNTNKSCLDAGNFTEDRIIDTAGEISNTKFVRLCKSRYDRRSGILTTEWNALVQNDSQKPLETKGAWKRQTYTVQDLRQIFRSTGFKLKDAYDRSLEKFDEKTSFSYLIVAEKVDS